MNRLWFITIFVLLWIGLGSAQEQQVHFPALNGPYLGQHPPGQTPVLFAPGFVTTGLFTRDVAMTPDGKEFYFGVVLGTYSYSTIVGTILGNDGWSEPEVVPFAADPSYKTGEPFISPDGKKFFFASNRPITGKEPSESDFDLWVMDHTPHGWGEPQNLGLPINTTAGEYFPSVTNDGTLYFTREITGGSNDIYRSHWLNGTYSEPEKLPQQINCGKAQFNAFISPDESYLIVPIFGRKDSKGSTDYYVVFRNPNDTWSEPINLGDEINTKGGNEYSPYVSPDGKFFFFMSARLRPDAFQPGEKLTYKKLLELHDLPGSGNPSIFWVDAKVITELKPKEIKSAW